MPLTNSLYDMNSTLRIRVTLALILIFTFYAPPNDSFTCSQVHATLLIGYVRRKCAGKNPIIHASPEFLAEY